MHEDASRRVLRAIQERYQDATAVPPDEHHRPRWDVPARDLVGGIEIDGGTKRVWLQFSGWERTGPAGIFRQTFHREWFDRSDTVPYEPAETGKTLPEGSSDPDPIPFEGDEPEWVRDAYRSALDRLQAMMPAVHAAATSSRSSRRPDGWDASEYLRRVHPDFYAQLPTREEDAQE